MRTHSEAMLSTILAFVRRVVCWMALLAIHACALLSPREALAWNEKRVESSTTTIELGDDGSASIQHELLLVLRGAPFTRLTLRGVDADAVPSPDATLTRLVDGQAAGAPERAIVRAQAGQLDVSVRSPRGLRGTTFLLKLGYRTRLAEGSGVRHLPDGLRSELGWTGPRYDDGVDAVTLILRTRAAELPPEVAPDEGSGPGYGVVMSTLRRSRDRDELELVRAHVARDEAIRWTFRVDRQLFAAGADAAGTSTTGTSTTGTSTVELSAALDVSASPARAAGERSALPYRLIASIAAAGFAYALLIALKSRSVVGCAALRGCTPRPWLGIAAAWRALLGGAAVSAAGALSISGESPLYAALALLIAMACAAYHRPREAVTLRGPGAWQPLEPNALEARPSAPLPGAWLDAGRARGFLLMLAALGGIATLAARAYSASPYTGACLLLGSSVLLPLFCTGRAGELPPHALSHAGAFLGDVSRRLARDATLVVKPIGRVAAAHGEGEERRLPLTTVRPVPGLLGLELGLELREHISGYCLRPVLVVRAAERSECQRTLPRGITWMRGRNADERASLIRPKLPSPESSVALIQELSALLLAGPEADADSKKAAKSSGSALSTANAGTRSSPAHAT